MKDTITISMPSGATREVSIFAAASIRQITRKVKTPKGWRTEEVDIRTLKIGASLDGGTIVANPFLETEI